MALTGDRGYHSIEPHTFTDVEKVCRFGPSDLVNANNLSQYQLVQKLYQPGSPQDIARIQDALQKLQRSQQGWQFADALLRSQDQKVRFFGALTFTIKINQDWQGVSAFDMPGTKAYPLPGVL